MKDIIDIRLQLLSKCKSNKELQKCETELCKRDILYFFKNYLRTDKNKTIFTDDSPTTIPFIPFPFQEEYITEVWESITEGNKPVDQRKPGVLTNVFVEKSRQMGISWVTAGIFVYGFIFHKHKYTIISRTADEVDKPGDMDSMFEKIRFMIRNIPTWMLPTGFSKESGINKTNAFMNITSPDGQAGITGKTANANAGRGGTRNAIFMDEMASMQYAHEINLATSSSTPCRIFNSTPNGEGNEFYRMRKKTSVTKDINGKDVPPEVKGLRYHRSDHPLYNSKWYSERIKGMSKEEIAQELEIDYNTAIVGRVYAEFPKKAINIAYDMTKPLYVAIDNSHGGTDPNAVIVMQPDGVYRNVIDYIEVNATPEDMAYYLTCQPRMQMETSHQNFLERYKNYNRRKAIFIADPYDTKVAMGNSVILEDYRKSGINLMLPQERDKQQQILKTRTNMYRLRYNDYCLDFASAIMNARYPETRESSNLTKPHTLPVHNRTSHARTALEYLVTYLIENPMAEKKKQFEDNRQRKDFRTGKLINRT